MSNPTSHNSLDELTAFSLGRLADDEAAAVERHVSECDQCCQTLLNLSSADDTFVELLQQAKRDATQPGPDSGESAVDLPPELADHPRYDVVELLGIGGMGRVYRARHRLMDRDVGLKVIDRRMVDNAEAVERFHREVRAAAQLSHPNIVTAHDAEQAGDVHFLVMECVDGIDLASAVRAHGPLPVGEACDCICQAAAGLQHAHEQGMIHRDVKPHNLMRTADGTIKILDFGLASLAKSSTHDTSAPAQSDLTAAGRIMGTPDYISPEQADDARRVDGRSDIYSLGATLYFLLAGRPPFDQGSMTEILNRHAWSEPERVSALRDDVPTGVSDALARMMSKSPDDRFPSAADLAEALHPFVDAGAGDDRSSTNDRMLRAPSPGLRPPSATSGSGKADGILANAAGHPTRNRRPMRIVAGMVVLLLIAAAIGVAMLPSNTGDTTTAEPSAATDATPPPPDAIRALNSIHLTRIEPGRFAMGTEPNRKATPAERVHQVEITKPFHIGTCEVTQQEFEWVMGRNPSEFSAFGAGAESVANRNTGRFPVENVSWHDAVEFCRRLSALPEARHAGHIFRLPTEAEWEYACRAQTATAFHFGQALNGTQANVDGRHPWGTPETGPALERTTTVGSYPPNAFGLYDMHGNVWEWCSDRYQLEYYSQSPESDPPGPATGTTRVVRGGAWDWGAIHARAATREQRDPDHRDHSLGFRVVRVSVSDDSSSLSTETMP